MPAVNLRRRASPVGQSNRSSQQVNGLYVHSSPPKGHYRLVTDFDDLSTIYIHTYPPRVVQMHPSVIRQWLRNGEIDQLEQVILEGQGHKLIGEYSPDPKVRSFLKTIPNYMSKIAELHDAVNKGNLNRLKSILSADEPTMKGLALCKDLSGTGLLHKATYNDHLGIVQWLLENHPETVRLKDRDGKTALHYCGASTAREDVWREMLKAGADPNVVDAKGRTAAYYMERPSAIEIPEAKPPSGSLKRFTSGKDGLVVKPSNIRIWIHDRDLGRLQQVLWEGFGNKLRMETSNNPRVKRFLDSIPYAMNAIKDVHAAVVNDDYEEFTKKTSEPVPVQILGSKDANGLNPLHKAAGLGRRNMVEDILDKNQKLLFSVDHEGRTPLHYAAWTKNNEYIYNLLIDNGANEMAFDNNGKLPAYYKANTKEPLAKFLSVIPDAPRTSISFPPSWDWSLLQSSARSNINIPQLVNSTDKDVQFAQKSFSDYDLNSLHPPENTEKPYFLFGNNVHSSFTETANEAGEKIAEIDVKMVSDENEENAEYGIGNQPPTEESRGDLTESGKPQEENSGNALPIENEEEFATGSPTTENHNEIAPEQTINIWPKSEEENLKSPETKPIEEQKNVDLTSSVIEKAGGETNENDYEQENEEPQEEEAEEEVIDVEKSEREIAEERQRLVDEGIVKVGGDEDEEPDDEGEVDKIIEKEDMQALATMVLEGEGERLLGKKSISAEIQGFLDNVPSYIAKINTVHKAARSGELRDLQAALDRRRFAVARDGSSSMGATPLHVAVLFGQTPIVKYLGGRFPETLDAKDKKGRTPLHYAATLADNSHYFNILLNLGADRKAKDNLNHMPSYYLENPGELTQEMLLQEFNAPAQIAQEMLSDKVKEDSVSSRRSLRDAELIAVLNRCYEIIELARREGSNVPLAKTLTRETFDRIKMRITKNDKNLLDVIWPGVRILLQESSNQEEICDNFRYSEHPESSNCVEELLMPMIKDTHNLGDKIPLLQPSRILSAKKDVGERGRTYFTDTENGGIIAPDAESYTVFEDVIMPITKIIQGIEHFERHPESNFFPNENDGDKKESEEIDFVGVKKNGGIFDKTRRKVNRMMKHFKNEVLPVGADFKMPPRYEDTVQTTNEKSLETFQAVNRRKHKLMFVEENMSEATDQTNRLEFVKNFQKSVNKNKTTVSNACAHYVSDSADDESSGKKAEGSGANIWKDDYKNVSISIINPNDEIMQVIVEEKVERKDEAGEVKENNTLLTMMKNKVTKIVRNVTEDLKKTNLNEIQVYFSDAGAEAETSLLKINNLDTSSKYVLSAKIECSRNLEKYQFPLALRENELDLIEEKLRSALKYQSIIGAEKVTISGGIVKGFFNTNEDQYYTMEEILRNENKITAQLSAKDLLIPLSESHPKLFHGNFWPRYRGVYLSSDKNLAAWINVQEHLRVVACTSMESPGHLGEVYARIARLITSLDKHLKPKKSERFGFIISRPSSLGNTLRFQVFIRLPRLATENQGLLFDFCRIHNLQASKSSESNLAFNISNRQCLGLSEFESYHAFASSIMRLIELEKSLMNEKSKQISSIINSILKSRNKFIHEDEKKLEITPETIMKKFPLFGTDEGKYLAKALGEPLIRGLTEVANKRPSDPVTYLANFLYDFVNTNKAVSSPVTDPSVHAREAEMQSNEGVPISRPRNEDIGNGEEDEDEQSTFNVANRDEYGQTIIHFAAARAHGRSGLYQLIQESDINIAYRDELYRTARDVAFQANIPENINEIDKFVIGLAARGETDKLMELLLEGYDHILDLEDDEDSSIIDIVTKKDQTSALDFLKSIPSFEERRERIHRAIRAGDTKAVEELVSQTNSDRRLLLGKSTTSRCSLHIAVLCQQETVTEFIAQKFPETLRIGDNLERTALHYAMGVDKVEILSKILIQCGAKRVVKDLKGRQPTYYFMNKSDILRLQEEEELLRM